MVQVPHHLLQSQAVGRYFADALATFLVEEKLPHLTNPQSRFAELVLLCEKGHSLPHLVNSLQLNTRHAECFFSSRAQFVPQMVNSLSRAPASRRAAARRRTGGWPSSSPLS